MSYKSENWQDKLAEVRNSIVSKEGSVEKTADEIINEEIEAELKSFFAEEPVELDEIQQKEVDALKKLSKEMQSVLPFFFRQIQPLPNVFLTMFLYQKMSTMLQ